MSTSLRPMQHPGFFTRTGIFRMLEGTPTHPGRRVVRVALALLIVLNVAAVVIESMNEVERAYTWAFFIFECVSVAIFSIEYILRLWVCVEDPRFSRPWGRLRFAATPMVIVDLIAIVPSLLGPIVSIDTRMLRALRLVRIFKLTRHSSSMELLLTVLRQETTGILSSMIIMLIVIVLAASGIYMIEREVQPEVFGSIPKSMWWAAVTLTTVGYGDVVPHTVLGRIFGLFVMVAGVGMVALPAGILASGFSLELNRRREAYRLQVQEALALGPVSRTESDRLDQERDELGLSDKEADLVMRAETLEHETAPTVCKHCGKPLN